MKNPFYNDIYEILRERGTQGLAVGIIARQVYNLHSGLFEELSYERVYRTVRFFLWDQAHRRKKSPFTAGQRGFYALRPDIIKQLQLNFKESRMVQEEPKEEPVQQTGTLFPDFF